MSQHQSRPALAKLATVRPAPGEVDRNFGLPTLLYGATIGLYLATLGVFALGFRDPGLALPMVIFTTYIVMAFGVPAMWARMKPDHTSRALGIGEFARRGIATASGHLTAFEASVQVLMLPVLILFWAAACVTIAAIVR